MKDEEVDIEAKPEKVIVVEPPEFPFWKRLCLFISMWAFFVMEQVILASCFTLIPSDYSLITFRKEDAWMNDLHQSLEGALKKILIFYIYLTMFLLVFRYWFTFLVFTLDDEDAADVPRVWWGMVLLYYVAFFVLFLGTCVLCIFVEALATIMVWIFKWLFNAHTSMGLFAAPVAAYNKITELDKP